MTITYPELSGNTTVENVATSCAQRLMISSITNNVNWLSNSINRTSLNPGESVILTASITNTTWASFSYGESRNAIITINSNDPDEPSKHVNVTASKGYPVCNVLIGDLSQTTNNPNGVGSWDWNNHTEGNNPCGNGRAFYTEDLNGSGKWGYFTWSVYGKAPNNNGQVKIKISDMKAVDEGWFASDVEWALYVDGNQEYLGILNENDGCVNFETTVSVINPNQNRKHDFQIRVYDQTGSKEYIWISKIQIEWCGWVVGTPNSNCIGCD